MRRERFGIPADGGFISRFRRLNQDADHLIKRRIRDDFREVLWMATTRKATWKRLLREMQRRVAEASDNRELEQAQGTLHVFERCQALLEDHGLP